MAVILRPGRFTSQPQYAAPINNGSDLARGLRGLWMPEGSGLILPRNKVTGNRSTAIIGTVAQSIAPFGRSYTFSTGSIDTNESVSIAGSDITIAVRVKFPTSTNTRIFGNSISGGPGYLLFQDGTGITMYLDGGAVGTSSGLTAGVWGQIAFSFVGGNKLIAVDGVVTSSAGAVSVSAQTATVQLGAYNWTGFPDYTGDAEYFAVWERGLTAAELITFQENPYRILQAPSKKLRFAGSSPDRTASLTGQSVTTAGGILAPSTAVALSGQAVTSAKGTLTPSIGVTVALTGQAVTSSKGTLAPATSITLTGQALTGSVGTLSPQVGGNVTLALTGQAVTSSQGTLVPSNSLALTGQAVTSAKGTLAPATSIALTGQATTSAPGTLTPTTSGQSITIQLTGQSVTLSKGSLSLDQYIWDTTQGRAQPGRGTFRPLETKKPEIVVVGIPEIESTYEHHPIANVVPQRQAPRAGLKWDFIPLPHTQPKAPARDYASLMAMAGQQKKTTKLSDFTATPNKKYLTRVRGEVRLKGN